MLTVYFCLIFALLFPHGKVRVTSFEQNWTPFLQRCLNKIWTFHSNLNPFWRRTFSFCQVLVKLAQWFWRRIILYLSMNFRRFLITVHEMFYFPTCTVSARWTNAELMQSGRCVNVERNLMNDVWMVNGEWVQNAREGS